MEQGLYRGLRFISGCASVLYMSGGVGAEAHI